MKKAVVSFTSHAASRRKLAPAVLILLFSGAASAASLSLVDAIRHTLDKNPNIKIQETQTAASLGALQQAAGQFDATVNLAGGYTADATPLNQLTRDSYARQGLDIPELKATGVTYSVALHKTLRNGLTLSPSISTTRSTGTTNDLNQQDAQNRAKVSFNILLPLSSSKPQWVVQDWLNDSLIHCEICSFEPATRAQICLAHDEDYVDGVLSCRYANGFGNYDPAIAESLPFVAGSMIHAAEFAIRNREVVCSPSSGSHHSGVDFGAGYCSFNALLIAAMVMKQMGLVERVAILDADRHFGDGSAQIIRHHGLKWIVHRSQGQHFNNRSDCLNGRYTRWLTKAISDCSGVDLVLHQAGVDGHIDDLMGGLHTT